MVFILTLLLFPIFIVIIFTPYWTRKTESFGVSIPEELYDSDELKEMRKKYAIQTTILSIVFVAVFLLSYFLISKEELVMTIIFGAMIVLYMIGSFMIYLVFHKQMKQKKQMENWSKEKAERIVISTTFREQNVTISGWLYVIPLAIPLITMLITFLFYDRIPEQVPMNYDLFGEVTRWKAKSYGAVLVLPLVQLFLVMVFFIVNIVIAKSKQQVNVQNPDVSMQKNIIFRRRWSIFMYITAIVITLMFALLHFDDFLFHMNGMIKTFIPIGVSILIIIGSIILTITTGQGGSRITLQSENDELVIDRDDDQHWKLGRFYINPDDPTLFIEKRFGVGWTINFGRPAAWVSLLGLIVIPLIPLLFSIL